MIDVARDDVFEIENLRTSVIDRQRVHAERRFERRELVKIVDDDLRNRVALQLNDHAGIFIRLIAHCGDVGNYFFVHQLGDALD